MVSAQANWYSPEHLPVWKLVLARHYLQQAVWMWPPNFTARRFLWYRQGLFSVC